MGISRMTLLIAVTTLLPLAWGWGVHRFVARLWPAGRPGAGPPGVDPHPSIPPISYHI